MASGGYPEAFFKCHWLLFRTHPTHTHNCAPQSHSYKHTHTHTHTHTQMEVGTGKIFYQPDDVDDFDESDPDDDLDI